MVWLLELCASTAGGVGFTPGQGTKIPHAVGYSKKKKKYNIPFNNNPLCWERLKARGERENEDEGVGEHHQLNGRWVWANSLRWWRTGKPQSTGSQRPRHYWATKPQQQLINQEGGVERERERESQSKEAREPCLVRIRSEGLHNHLALAWCHTCLQPYT